MSIVEQITRAIEQSLPGAQVHVETGSPGHYSLHVKSDVFRGKTMVECHRVVYAAIAGLMAGNAAPVHAIDRLRTEPA